MSYTTNELNENVNIIVLVDAVLLYTKKTGFSHTLPYTYYTLLIVLGNELDKFYDARYRTHAPNDGAGWRGVDGRLMQPSIQ